MTDLMQSLKRACSFEPLLHLRDLRLGSFLTRLASDCIQSQATMSQIQWIGREVCHEPPRMAFYDCAIVMVNTL